ncbi:MAG: Hydroxypyruvate reductase [Candidatus Levybacteria bacterium]|nr:Hydroxypyruvate reductase [Candidatus Levybacteria bacterium]
MGLIKNFDSLNKTPERKICLELIESALFSIQPQNIISKNFSLNENILTIQEETFDLSLFERIFLLGFGKGSAGLSKQIETLLGKLLTDGYVIDLGQEQFYKIQLTIGTHPLPSETNVAFTKNALERLGNLTERDLVLVVIAGGGSALFENPYRIDLEKLIKINKSLLSCGATIAEMNIVRKHLSLVKGGGLIKSLFPARIISVIASDVPGNDLSVIASGPTVKDKSTKEQVLEVLKKYNLLGESCFPEKDFIETPKEDKYFTNSTNILLVSNQTALQAMQSKAKELGFNAKILTDKLQGDAKTTGKELIDKTPSKQILLVGGETTVKVVNKNGKGGRNQDLVLATLPFIDDKTTIVSFNSDGWDNSEFTGAIGDLETINKAKELNLNPKEYLDTDNSFIFFEKIGDGIVTGRLPSNVSDLMIVLKM